MFNLAIFAVLLSSLFATPVDTNLLRLDEVTVTAVHRHASTVSSQSSVEVTSQKLNEQLQSSLAQSLNSIAGVQAASIGSGQARPAIRGMGFNRLAIVHDAIRHEGQQ